MGKLMTLETFEAGLKALKTGMDGEYVAKEKDTSEDGKEGE